MKVLKKYSLACIPVILSLILLAVYLINKDFYLTYILSGLNREAQAVEMFTFLLSLLSSLVLFKNAFILYKNKEFQGSFYLIFILALAAFFLAGEESSWGQSYFFWRTPEFYDCTSLETNIHNTAIPVQSLGSLFLICYFVIIPYIYHKKLLLNLNKSFSVAIAEIQIIFCLLYAFAWKGIKEGHKIIYSKEFLNSYEFYNNFIEQINEQKEFLVVIAITIYAFNIDLKVTKIK